MPEMMTPMQHINAHRQLKRMSTLISDGRYSGVTFGAAIGHMTPEAFHRGEILYLQDGDLLQLRLRGRGIDLLNAGKFAEGTIELNPAGEISCQRQALGEQRLHGLRQRQRMVAATNRLRDCTDASRGVVPQGVALEAELDWRRADQEYK
ncbi:dihydroxy-acid dehydratase [Paenibacillus sp. TAB 01]|uniref:dihydroxy-acid dehydratase domain-containing protein n=1 Tax=Paenibacillus sp. TAB 01 TaxID=3368988 RepID=UPI003751CEBE